MENTSIKTTQEVQKTPVFIADVGGTNVRLGIDYGTGEQPVYTKYKVAAHDSFEDIVAQFAYEKGVEPELFVIGSCGCVDEINETVKGSNSRWSIRAAQLKQTFPTLRDVRLVNDFYLMAEGAHHLKPDDYTVLQGYQPLNFDRMNVVIMGAGTGWGTSFSLRQQHKAPTIHTSESGHVCLPKLTFDDPELEADNQKIIQALRERFEVAPQKGLDKDKLPGVVVEHIISGSGIRNIYGVLTNGSIPLDLGSMVDSKTVEQKAKDGDPVAKRTFQIFNAYVGLHTGNVASVVNANAVIYTASFSNEWISKQMAADPLFHHYLTANRSGMTNPMKHLVVVAAKDEDLPKQGLLKLADRLRTEDDEKFAIQERLDERVERATKLLSSLVILSQLSELADNAKAQRDINEMQESVRVLFPRIMVPLQHRDAFPMSSIDTSRQRDSH